MSDGSIINGFLTLGIIVLALGAILLLIKKYAKKSGRLSGGMSFDVISKISLQPKANLFVVKIADRTLLIGTTEHNINTLADLTSEDGSQGIDSAHINALIGNKKLNPARRNIKLPQSAGKTVDVPIDENSLTFGSFLKSAFKKQVN